MALPNKEDRLPIERTVQEIYASKECHGRAGPGRSMWKISASWRETRSALYVARNQ